MLALHERAVEMAEAAGEAAANSVTDAGSEALTEIAKEPAKESAKTAIEESVKWADITGDIAGGISWGFALYDLYKNATKCHHAQSQANEKSRQLAQMNLDPDASKTAKAKLERDITLHIRDRNVLAAKMCVVLVGGIGAPGVLLASSGGGVAYASLVGLKYLSRWGIDYVKQRYDRGVAEEIAQDGDESALKRESGASIDSHYVAKAREVGKAKAEPRSPEPSTFGGATDISNPDRMGSEGSHVPPTPKSSKEKSNKEELEGQFLLNLDRQHAFDPEEDKEEVYFHTMPIAEQNSTPILEQMDKRTKSQIPMVTSPTPSAEPYESEISVISKSQLKYQKTIARLDKREKSREKFEQQEENLGVDKNLEKSLHGANVIKLAKKLRRSNSTSDLVLATDLQRVPTESSRLIDQETGLPASGDVSELEAMQNNEEN